MAGARSRCAGRGRCTGGRTDRRAVGQAGRGQVAHDRAAQHPAHGAACACVSGPAARGSVRLVARAHRGASVGKGRPVSRARVVRFRRAGRRVVRLKLTGAGRRAIAGCEPMRLSVRGRWRAGRQRRGSRPGPSKRQTGASARLRPLPPHRARREARRAGRIGHGRPLRLHRGDRLPLPLAERPLHGPRREHGERPPPEPSARSRCRRTATARASRPPRTTATTASAPAT